MPFRVSYRTRQASIKQAERDRQAQHNAQLEREKIERAQLRAREQYYIHSINQILPTVSCTTLDLSLPNCENVFQLTATERAEYDLQLKVIESVLRNNQNIESYKLELSSNVPNLIAKVHTIHQSRKTWLRKNKELLVNKRGEYLFNYFQYKLYLDSIANAIIHNLSIPPSRLPRQPGATINVMKKYIHLYAKIVEASTQFGIFNIDLFVKYFNPGSESYKDLANLGDVIKSTGCYYYQNKTEILHADMSELTISAAKRKLSSTQMNEFQTILETQLRILSDKYKISLADTLCQAMEYDCRNDLVSAEIKIAYQNMTRISVMNYLNDCSKVCSEYIQWHKTNTVKDEDLVDIHQRIKSRTDANINRINAIPVKSNKGSAIDNVALTARFNLYQGIPILFWLMQKYSHSTNTQKNSYLQKITYLLQRGASAFAKVKLSDSSEVNAFEYAGINHPSESVGLDWPLLEAILAAMIGYSPFAETLRVELLQYCQNESRSWISWFVSLPAVRSYGMGSFLPNSQATQQYEIFDLLQSLDNAIKTASDNELIAKVKSLSLASHSSLKTTAKHLLKEMDEGALLALTGNEPFATTPADQRNRFFSSNVASKQAAEISLSIQSVPSQPTTFSRT